MVKTESGLERMFRQQEEYDEVCRRAAAYKTEEDQLKAMAQQLLGAPLDSCWFERSPGEFVSTMLKSENDK